MDRETIRRRRAELLAEERERECRWFWLSFSDEGGFKGGCYVLAPGFATAVEWARERGLNPGGEVIGFILPPDTVPPKELHNRLLQKDDLEANGGAVEI